MFVWLRPEGQNTLLPNYLYFLQIICALNNISEKKRHIITIDRVKYTDGPSGLPKFWISFVAFQKYTDGPCGLPKFWISFVAFQKYTDGPCGLHFVMHLVLIFFQK
ncbi:hypothetical protein Hanom_Chr12g01126531 [Helianthus anomalus]